MTKASHPLRRDEGGAATHSAGTWGVVAGTTSALVFNLFRVGYVLRQPPSPAAARPATLNSRAQISAVPPTGADPVGPVGPFAETPAFTRQGRRRRAPVCRSTITARHGGPLAAMVGHGTPQPPCTDPHWPSWLKQRCSVVDSDLGAGGSRPSNQCRPRPVDAPTSATATLLGPHHGLAQDPTGGSHSRAGPHPEDGGFLWRPARREPVAPLCPDVPTLRDTQPCQGRHYDYDCVGEKYKTTRSVEHGLLHCRSFMHGS